ncbi:MAG: magnesium transporter CorA family protein [Clostridia bacterium]|nr:magnesium transporter CorA family protein [Clostridia bacterium]
MVEMYKTVDNQVKKLENFEDGAWINVTSPTTEEIQQLKDKFKIETTYLTAVTDEEERSRIEVNDEGQTLVVIDIPSIEKQGEVIVYSTVPLGIIMLPNAIITVCSEENSVINDFSSGRIKGFYTNFKNRFVLQILYRVAYTFVRYLRHIDKITERVEKQLYKSMGNDELLDLLALEKSMVYFSTSLKSNELVLEKMLKLEYLKQYPDDMELLEDVIIENKQAIEMTNIFTGILSGTMDTFASIISNNVNNVMKFLTSVTILITIPTLVSSIYGMNVNLPFQNNPYAFYIVMGIALVVSVVPIFFLYKRRMF